MAELKKDGVRYIVETRNTRRLKRLRSGFEILTVVLMIYTLNAILSERDARRAQNDQNFRNQAQNTAQLACLAVAFYPDDAGDLFKYLRAKYNCPPFDANNLPQIPGSTRSSSPGATSMPIIRSSTSPTGGRSSSSSQTPGVTQNPSDPTPSKKPGAGPVVPVTATHSPRPTPTRSQPVTRPTATATRSTPPPGKPSSSRRPTTKPTVSSTHVVGPVTLCLSPLGLPIPCVSLGPVG